MGSYVLNATFSESISNIGTASDFWFFSFLDNGTCVQLWTNFFRSFEKVGKLRSNPPIGTGSFKPYLNWYFVYSDRLFKVNQWITTAAVAVTFFAQSVNSHLISTETYFFIALRKKRLPLKNFFCGFYSRIVAGSIIKTVKLTIVCSRCTVRFHQMTDDSTYPSYKIGCKGGLDTASCS